MEGSDAVIRISRRTRFPSRPAVRRAGRVVLLCLCASVALPAALSAEELSAAAPVESETPSKDRDEGIPVDLETLLRLPDSYRTGGERRGGIDRNEWQARFVEARGDVDAKNAELDRLQDKLASLASSGGQWQAGAPGLSNTDPQHQTLSYKLRQELRAARIAITDAERGMLEVGVQADLAGVPQDWRE